jgi:hypothetical protein
VRGICSLAPTAALASCRGETVRIEFPANPTDRIALQGHYDDFEAAIAASIQTCDADVLQELLERQEDFPKMWNRANERLFTRMGEGGRGASLQCGGQLVLPHVSSLLPACLHGRYVRICTCPLVHWFDDYSSCCCNSACVECCQQLHQQLPASVKPHCHMPQTTAL